ATAAGNEHLALLALTNQSADLVWLGRSDEAIASARDALARARRLGSDYGQGGALIRLGAALHFAGQDTEAEQRLVEALAIGRRRQEVNPILDPSKLLGDCRRAVGDLAGARRYYDEAERAVQGDKGGEPDRADLDRALAELALAERRPVEAEPLAR